MKRKPKNDSADYSALLPIFKKVTFLPNVAMRRQVTLRMRELIESQELKYPARLPPIRVLADLWDTNYFTVQAALRQLVGEGLLTQSPKRGTFVAQPTTRVRRVCIYHDHQLRFESNDSFYSQLNVWVYRVLSEEGLIAAPYFDNRPREKKHTIPPVVRDMIKDRQADAVIATAILASLWLDHLSVPVSSTMETNKTGRIGIDYREMVRLVMAELKMAEKKRLGVILHPGMMDAKPSNRRGELLRNLKAAAAQEKVQLLFPPDHLLADTQKPWEESAYSLFEGLMSHAQPPETVFVFPDSYMRGVSTAILQKRLSVPSDVAVIAHRNDESPIYMPFPVTWISVRIEDFARGMVRQIHEQVERGKAAEVLVPCRIVRTG